ncbi:hypothetical protein OH77DRAFT_1425735 [Trametes cingulata]|nr:hypothetical protein OH77DRAFT_1425735 [Trametes cingulata]
MHNWSWVRSARLNVICIRACHQIAAGPSGLSDNHGASPSVPLAPIGHSGCAGGEKARQRREGGRAGGGENGQVICTDAVTVPSEALSFDLEAACCQSGKPSAHPRFLVQSTACLRPGCGEPWCSLRKSKLRRFPQHSSASSASGIRPPQACAATRMARRALRARPRESGPEHCIPASCAASRVPAETTRATGGPPL